MKERELRKSGGIPLQVPLKGKRRKLRERGMTGGRFYDGTSRLTAGG